MPAASPGIEQECVEGYLFVSAPLTLLLLQRPVARDSIWAPVSGKVEASDRDYPSALRREIREETGFSAVERLFPLGWEVPFEGPDRRTWRLHAYGVELPARLPPHLSDEHVTYAWLRPAEARRRLHYPDNQAAVDRLLGRIGNPPVPTRNG